MRRFRAAAKEDYEALRAELMKLQDHPRSNLGADGTRTQRLEAAFKLQHNLKHITLEVVLATPMMSA